MSKDARNNVTKNQPCVDGSWEIVDHRGRGYYRGVSKSNMKKRGVYILWLE